MVVRVAQQAQKCPLVSEILIVTDSDDIVHVLGDFGFASQRSRREHQSGSDRIAEALENHDAPHVINLQADEPFVHPNDLFELIKLLQEGKTQMATLKRPITKEDEMHDPNVVKVVTDDADRALYFSRSPIPHQQTFSPKDAWAHLGIYAYQRETLLKLSQIPRHPLEDHEKLEQLRALAMGLPITVKPAMSMARGIDTAEDLTWAQDYVQKIGADAFPQFSTQK
jgi:3-deoxy-manno-octulosonate cytidylyltransferase (CMP-KDO synthetase)